MEDSPVILVVEDDLPIQIIVEDALVDGGFEPAIAPSGEEAVTLLEGARGRYHALVIDITLLGRLDGWEVAKRAREIDPTFPSSTSPLHMPTSGPLKVFRTAFF